ncbi:MAG TPA: GNAT family N-acetyltransferase [Thermomicrobiaceae bacterium]|nr:GNAT family N-acetyltransferase [Thermomicrobiaceae bacterium]
MRHPEHDRLIEAVPGWYTRSFPDMGYRVERRSFGFYARNDRAAGANRVTLRDLGVGDVPALLADLRRSYDGEAVRILVDDRSLDAGIGPPLLATGCVLSATETFLAHVGPLPALPEVGGLTIEPGDEANLTEYAATKLKGFADSEAEPAPEALAAELALRRAELAGDGELLLARVDGEPAAILGAIAGPDWLIFQLATRLPFRGRGIARCLLGRALAAARERGGGAVLTNADPQDTPVQLYRRLGFSDEVYWRRTYLLPAAAS